MSPTFRNRFPPSNLAHRTLPREPSRCTLPANSMRENLSPELLYETTAPATRGEGHVLRRPHLPLHRVRIAHRGNGTTRSAAPGWVSIRRPLLLIAG